MKFIRADSKGDSVHRTVKRQKTRTLFIQIPRGGVDESNKEISIHRGTKFREFRTSGHDASHVSRISSIAKINSIRQKHTIQSQLTQTNVVFINSWCSRSTPGAVAFRLDSVVDLLFDRVECLQMSFQHFVGETVYIESCDPGATRFLWKAESQYTRWTTTQLSTCAPHPPLYLKELSHAEHHRDY